MSNDLNTLSSCQPGCGCGTSLTRRDFLRLGGLVAAGATMVEWPVIAGPFEAGATNSLVPLDKKLDPAWIKSLYDRGTATEYTGKALAHIGIPVGGICAGQLYLGGDGRLWHWDIFNVPQESRFCDSGGPNYANPPKEAAPIDQGFAVKVTSGGKSQTRVLDARGFQPEEIKFRGQYPMAFVDYQAPGFPVTASLEAFSPFIPLKVADSSLPVTLMSFTVKNTSSESVQVEVGGWMENAVCLGSGKPGRGQRRNKIARSKGLVFVQGTAERLPAKTEAPVRPQIVFEDFEHGYGQWKIEGDAFGPKPATGTLANQNPVEGFLGKGLVNTYYKGDATQGTMTSPSFVIARRNIAFLIGGGSKAGKTCMNLVLDGKVVRTATGRDTEMLEWAEWEVSEFEGKTAQLQIVDQSTEGWGHVNVDQIVFTDESLDGKVALEAREDYGSMGLGLLGVEQGSFARTQLSGESVHSLFEEASEKAESDFQLAFGQKLTGAVGRRFTLAPGEEKKVTFVVTWYFPGLLRGTIGQIKDIDKLKRSYAKRFASATEVCRYVADNFERLAGQTRLWNKTWYDSTLPHWFLDRVFAPICTLATSTCHLFDSGRFYAFEGVYCCQGSCQHVWNYAQSVARIFPDLERDLRERTDFGTSWHENGAIDYRGENARHVAHDGQCGVILRAWREHQMSPDNRYLKATWPRIKKSIQYMMGLDPDKKGILEGEQYNTLDAAWFGPMAWISSLYIGCLRAGEAMATEAGDKDFAVLCRQVAERGSQELVKSLYNGEYFIHKLDPKHLEATNTNDGCHIDQLMGQAWAMQVGLPRISPVKETLSALEAIWKYNFTPDVGPYRDKSSIKGGRWYAMAGEGGVIMTTFPHGGADKAVGKGGFGFYFNEVWTGQEHQLAAQMIGEGLVDYGMVITRMVHDRHHALRRNPYNEVECSDHYTRAMASHGSLIAACGYEYHGPKGHLGFAPKITPHQFKAPFTASEGWGTFEQSRNAEAQTESIQIAFGRLKLSTLAFTVAENRKIEHIKVMLNNQEVSATLTMAGTRVQVTLASSLEIKEGQTLKVALS